MTFTIRGNDYPINLRKNRSCQKTMEAMFLLFLVIEKSDKSRDISTSYYINSS